MPTFPLSMQKLINELSRLPSVGEKSATRLAYFLVNGDRGYAKRLSQVITEAVEKVCFCERCFHLTDQPLCPICADPSREHGLVCVVEKPSDLIAFERMGEFHGVYHVLHGLWAPLRGQGPEKMKLGELMARLKAGGVSEVIIATGSTVEGEATALYVARMVNELGVRTSRLAQGLPRGGELEYADELTLSRAFSGRSQI